MRPAAIAVLLSVALAGCGSSAPPQITIGAARTYRLAGFPSGFVAGKPQRATFRIDHGSQSYVLVETSPGVYSRSVPALVMVGHWGLSFDITPPGKSPFTVLFVDRANG